MGMFDDLIPEGPKTPAASGGGMFDDLIPKEKPFLEKVSNFLSKVYNDPPPSIAAARDVIKAAPGASQIDLGRRSAGRRAGRRHHRRGRPDGARLPRPRGRGRGWPPDFNGRGGTPLLSRCRRWARPHSKR